MDRAQAITLVRDTFTQRFDDDRFTLFTRNLLNHLDESKKQTWTLKKAAFEDYVNHFTRLGTYADPRGERLDVLVIHLRKDTTLARGRVTLRNFVADYLATGHGQGKAAVIAAFVSPSEEDWRFSFVKLDYTLEKTELGIVTERAQLTPARRYSYLVGKHENCHTAQKQFLELLQTDTADPTLAQLETAFSVEKVTKEFYDHYKDLFEKTRDALKDVLKVQPSIAAHFDERGIENDDFAKKLLGQIVFLYFLQKKGWFGVEPRKAWGTGRKDFIRHLFRERASFASLLAKKAKRETNFFNDILEPLFYEALAIDRSDNGDHYSLFDCKIPFLNGGLFEPIYGYQWQTTDILLPDTLFSNDEPTGEGEEKGTGILDVFDRYNFTVNEAEPLEKEVAVDPEMLGKVFENLLPENIRHASGTYYTPRVIVGYMCQQALLHYLAARAPQVPQNDLALFLRHAERFADFEAKDKKSYAERGLLLPESISQNAAPLDDLLATITVCDPAIGSGAFPVGMMHEIVRARIALTHTLVKSGDIRAQKPRSAYALKRDAIHHSLYGVDLDPGAVEIASRLFGEDDGFDEWMDEMLDLRPETDEEKKELKRKMREVKTTYIKPVLDYEFPMVTLAENTTPEAVCTIFETLNRTGVKLSVFDLLAARFWPEDVRIRENWLKALEDFPIIAEFDVDPYYVLQSISLFSAKAAPSCKRSDVLKMDISQIKAGWQPVIKGLADGLHILRDECGVILPHWLPYNTIVVTLAAICAHADGITGPAAAAKRNRIIRWFWCSVFGQTYENSPNSQAAKDYIELVKWLDTGLIPKGILEFNFEPALLRQTTPRQRAVYRGVICLILRNEARDFHTGKRITVKLIEEEKIDDHHIFPQGYIATDLSGVTNTLRDCVLNRTLIDKTTNIHIGKLAPSDYLQEIKQALGADFEKLLSSHLLPSGSESPLLKNNFEEYLNSREKLLGQKIKEVTS